MPTLVRSRGDWKRDSRNIEMTVTNRISRALQLLIMPGPPIAPSNGRKPPQSIEPSHPGRSKSRKPCRSRTYQWILSQIETGASKLQIVGVLPSKATENNRTINLMLNFEHLLIKTVSSLSICVSVCVFKAQD